MGRIAQIRVKCPNCAMKTNIFIEETAASSAKVKCEHCMKIFEFAGGMLYEPVGYVAAMPEWAKIQQNATAPEPVKVVEQVKAPEPVAAPEPGKVPEPVKALEPVKDDKKKKWWEFWK